jgi:hypothetical protein
VEITEQQDQLDRIEAMLEIMLERVPNGKLAWSRSEQYVPQRVRKNRERRAEHEAHLKKEQQADAAWRIPRAHRESLLLQVLGDERLILRELTERLNAELGFPSRANPNHAVHQGQVRSLVRHMFRTGQLERAEESFQNKPRNRYFRSCPPSLEGPIVELEQAYGAA